MKINLKMMEYPYHSVVTFSEIKILLMFQKHLTTICFLFSGFKKPLLSRFKKPLIIGNIFLQRLLTAAYFVDFKLRLLEVNNRLNKHIPVSQMTIFGIVFLIVA